MACSTRVTWSKSDVLGGPPWPCSGPPSVRVSAAAAPDHSPARCGWRRREQRPDQGGTPFPRRPWSHRGEGAQSPRVVVAQGSGRPTLLAIARELPQDLPKGQVRVTQAPIGVAAAQGRNQLGVRLHRPSSELAQQHTLAAPGLPHHEPDPPLPRECLAQPLLQLRQLFLSRDKRGLLAPRPLGQDRLVRSERRVCHRLALGETLRTDRLGRGPGSPPPAPPPVPWPGCAGKPRTAPVRHCAARPGPTGTSAAGGRPHRTPRARCAASHRRWRARTGPHSPVPPRHAPGPQSLGHAGAPVSAEPTPRKPRCHAPKRLPGIDHGTAPRLVASVQGSLGRSPGEHEHAACIHRG